MNSETKKSQISDRFNVPDDPDGTVTHYQCKRCKEWVAIAPMHSGASTLQHHMDNCKKHFDVIS